MLNEEKRKELAGKIAYKNWQLRARPVDEQGEDNPLFGYGSEETDYNKAVKIVAIFEGEVQEDRENIQDYIDLFSDILEIYYEKDYISTYVQ